MCNKNENAQMRPVDSAEAKIDLAALGENQIKPCLPFPTNSGRCLQLARENRDLSDKIFSLNAFLQSKDCEKIAGAKQVELMRGQLEAMESYKRFLSCRIADLALSDFEPSEEKKGA